MSETAAAAVPVAATPSSMSRVVLRLAGPVMVERVSISLLSVVDGVLVGRYVGADGVAAVGLGSLLFWVPLAGAFGLSVATTAVVARDYGANDLRTLERSLRAGVLIALAWGVVAALALWFLAGPLLRLMAARADVERFGIDYMRAAALGFPLLMALYAATGAMRGVGNTWLPMCIVIVVNATNALVAFLLISGVVGVELEVLASGIGYASGSALGGLLALAALAVGVGPARYRVEQVFATGRREAARLVNIGLPATLEEFQFMIAFIAYSRVITGLGTVAQAAHTIALRTLEVAIVPGFALGTAATTLVGQYLGARRPDLAERVALVGRNWAVGMLLVMGTLLALFAPQFVSLFVDDPEVIEVGSRLLRIFAIAFPFMGLHASLSGALRGAGDVRYVLGALTVTAWFVRIPTAVLLGIVAGLGAPGAWAGAALENTVRGMLIWHRFRQGAWKEKRV